MIGKDRPGFLPLRTRAPSVSLLSETLFCVWLVEGALSWEGEGAFDREDALRAMMKTPSELGIRAPSKKGPDSRCFFE